MNNKLGFAPGAVLLALVFALSACSITPTSPMKSQGTVDVYSSFQSQLSPVPPLPRYMCGAWSSNNAPSIYGIITVYAKLTHDVIGVSGASARATVHFSYASISLGDPLTSDRGGYVAFYLPLTGRQPRGIPATVDVSFDVHGVKVQCSAFFTPW